MKTVAVEPLSEGGFQELCKDHVVELIPGKSVHTIKAYTGRLKTRGVGCGNYQHGEKRTKLDTFSGGIDARSLRSMLRNAALRQWKVGTLDGDSGKSASGVPYDRHQGKVLEVRKALCGLDVSPRSWSLSRNKALRQVDELRQPPEKADEAKATTQEVKATPVKSSVTVPESQVPSQEEFVASINRLEHLRGIPAKFMQLAEDANVRKVVTQDPDETVIGAIGLCVDDILITGQGDYAELIASTLSQQWKTSKPQWLDQEGLAFHGFETRQEGSAIFLHQENFVAEMLSRYMWKVLPRYQP